MNNKEKAQEIAENSKQYFYHDEYECGLACALRMAKWKDEQLESKLMQIIILAQQGYTSGATDKMILKHCKEIINENYEHNTTTTD
jgi:hypothetical protein